jgi:hypothetical protein
MNAVEVKGYECPVCHQHFETKEQAEACNSGYEPKPGDVIQHNGSVWVVKWVDQDVCMAYDPDWRKAMDRDIPKPSSYAFLGRTALCNKSKPFPMLEALRLVEDLRRRYESAQKFLEKVEKMHASAQKASEGSE